MPDGLTKILLVEDELSIRLSMSALLSEAGYTLRTAEDGFTALCEMRRGMPDILLSDLNMPGMTGFELLSVVRQRFPAIRTIAMSGAFVDDGVPYGIVADAYYAKGGGVEALLQILHALSRTERDFSCASSATAPLWIYRDMSDPSLAASVTIACPECLRTSSQTLHGSVDQVQVAKCAYCHRLIHFAIAKPCDKPPVAIRSNTSIRPESAPIPVTQYFY